jgi:hypothetical protein
VSEPPGTSRALMPVELEAAQRPGPLNEKAFYLEEFYGKGLLFALIPPAGQRLRDLDSLARALRELVRNQTRCILIAAEDVLPRVWRRASRRRSSTRPGDCARAPIRPIPP